MKTKRVIPEHNLTITNEFVCDAGGEVTHEDIVCETSTRLPVVKLADVATMLNDQMREDQAAA